LYSVSSIAIRVGHNSTFTNMTCTEEHSRNTSLNIYPSLEVIELQNLNQQKLLKKETKKVEE